MFLLILERKEERDRDREGERENVRENVREKHQSTASPMCLAWGSNSQPRYVP